MKRLCLAVGLAILLAACASPTPTLPPLAADEELYTEELGYEAAEYDEYYLLDDGYPAEECEPPEDYPEIELEPERTPEPEPQPDTSIVDGSGGGVIPDFDSLPIEEAIAEPVVGLYIEAPPRTTITIGHQAALDRVGGGQTREIEHGFYDGRQVWKFFIEFGGANFRVYIDAETWEVARFVQHGQVAPDTDPASYMMPALDPVGLDDLPAPVITQQQAIEIALAHAGDGSSVNREGFLGFEDGRQVWFVWVARGQERIQATVTADTGEVVRVRHW